MNYAFDFTAYSQHIHSIKQSTFKTHSLVGEKAISCVSRKPDEAEEAKPAAEEAELQEVVVVENPAAEEPAAEAPAAENVYDTPE